MTVGELQCATQASLTPPVRDASKSGNSVRHRCGFDTCRVKLLENFSQDLSGINININVSMRNAKISRQIDK